MLKKNQGRVGAPFLLQKNGIAEEWNRGRKEWGKKRNKFLLYKINNNNIISKGINYFMKLIITIIVILLLLLLLRIQYVFGLLTLNKN